MRYLGKAELYKRVNPVNLETFHDENPYEERNDIRSPELKQAAGHKHSRIAELHEPIRARHAETVQHAQDLRQHNERIVKGQETDPQLRREASAAKAQDTKQTNRVNRHAAEIDTTDVLDSWAATDQPTAEEEPEEEAFINPFS